MNNSISTKGIHISGEDLIDIGDKLNKYLDNIEDSSNRIFRGISMMNGYDDSLSNVTDTTVVGGKKEIKYKKWRVVVSGDKIEKIDFGNLRRKVSLLTKNGDDLEEISRKLDSMVKRVERLLGPDNVNDYFFGDLGKYCQIDESFSNVASLHPELENKKEEFLKKCEEMGIKVKVTATVRTVEEQNKLFAQGRTAGGRVVTNAEGSNYGSNHQWGIAFDVCVKEYKDKSGKWVVCESDEEKYDDNKLKKVGEIGKSVGLEWGGDWIEFTDTPHFQLRGYDNLREKYGEPAKFATTWYK